MTYKKLCFLYSGSPKSVEAYELLTNKYSNFTLEECDVIVSLGGDGFLLQVLHDNPTVSQPVFAMNRGTIGFLLNEYREENLLDRINNSQDVMLCPITMEATNTKGEKEIFKAYL